MVFWEMSTDVGEVIRKVYFFAILFTKRPDRKGVRNRNRMIWRNVFRMRGCARQVPFQNQGTSKGLKKCLNAKRHSGQLAFAQTIPSHRLTTFFHSLKKFQRIPPKSHGPHLSALRKCIQSVRFASCMLHAGSSVKQNRRENRETARLGSFTICKAFRRAFVTVAILLLSSHMNRAENRTLLQVPFCRE